MKKSYNCVTGRSVKCTWAGWNQAAGELSQNGESLMFAVLALLSAAPLLVLLLRNGSLMIIVKC
jgi:hypothetical protein